MSESLVVLALEASPKPHLHPCPTSTTSAIVFAPLIAKLKICGVHRSDARQGAGHRSRRCEAPRCVAMTNPQDKAGSACSGQAAERNSQARALAH